MSIGRASFNLLLLTESNVNHITNNNTTNKVKRIGDDMYSTTIANSANSIMNANLTNVNNNATSNCSSSSLSSTTTTTSAAHTFFIHSKQSQQHQQQRQISYQSEQANNENNNSQPGSSQSPSLTIKVNNKNLEPSKIIAIDDSAQKLKNADQEIEEINENYLLSQSHNNNYNKTQSNTTQKSFTSSDTFSYVNCDSNDISTTSFSCLHTYLQRSELVYTPDSLESHSNSDNETEYSSSTSSSANCSTSPLSQSLTNRTDNLTKTETKSLIIELNAEEDEAVEIKDEKTNYEPLLTIADESASTSGVSSQYTALQESIQSSSPSDSYANSSSSSSVLSNQSIEPDSLQQSEDSHILDKIRKINKLQEKINDISSKIKSIDMNNSKNKTNNYYCLQSELDLIDEPEKDNDSNNKRKNIVKEDKDDEDNFDVEENFDMIDNEQFFDYNQYFDGPDTVTQFFDEEDEDEYGDKYSRYVKKSRYSSSSTDAHSDNESNSESNSDLEYDCRGEQVYENDADYDDNDNDELDIDDEEDEEEKMLRLFKYNLKRAQPVPHRMRKFASTGLLFHKFGYLDPIDEGEEPPVVDAPKLINDCTANMSLNVNCFTSSFGKKTSSTSCFHLNNLIANAQVVNSNNNNSSSTKSNKLNENLAVNVSLSAFQNELLSVRDVNNESKGKL